MNANLTDYRLLGLVGQGQFAQVYCAIHRRSGQVVAIKQVRHTRQQSSQESVLLPQLHHPNIVSCYTVEPSGGGDRLILEYCESGTLRHYLNALGKLSLQQSKSLFTNILSALSHIHTRQWIHDDLKPENILLTYGHSDRASGLMAKISDVGSACRVGTLNRSSQEIGSPFYAAPERFSGHASYASDLYSVGVILYEMLLGDRPFSGTPQELAYAHSYSPVHIPSTLSPAAAQLLGTALHKDSQQRFASADAMLSALQQLTVLHRSAPPPPEFTREENLELSIENAIAPTDRSFSFEGTLSASQEGYIESAALALSEGDRLHISTDPTAHQTHLTCSAQREQLTSQYALNFTLSYAALTLIPHQLIACTDGIAPGHPTAMLISLKPFQIRYLPCLLPTQCACATPWGYVIVCRNNILFFDRDNNLLGKASHRLEVSAIASPTPHQLILSTPKSAASHQLLNLNQLALDIIF